MIGTIFGDSNDAVQTIDRFLAWRVDEGFTTSSRLRSLFYKVTYYPPMQDFCNEMTNIQSFILFQVNQIRSTVQSVRTFKKIWLAMKPDS
mmetsp:Transcript_4413/g.5700  ORF Transcript_4413/g.5700 Transcript_4413/m.5700 type:complete len:90 (+) Transcript_4413:603-872(+)